MKNTLTMLALSASTALLADACCEPKPCCVPQPRAPICCECYVPSFYDMQCNVGLFVDVEFLYWYANETDLSYAALAQTSTVTTQSTPTTATLPVSYQHLKSRWEPGFRVGLGWNMDDGWDLYLNYTWYQNNKKSTTSVDAFTTEFPALGAYAVNSPWSNKAFFLANDADTLFNSVSGKWHMRFNQVDLEMGRRYYLSQCFTMRPYAGLRGAWIHTDFNVSGFAQQAVISGTTPATGTYSFNTSDKFRNRNWGVGLLAGFQPAFYFTEEFSLYANADMALLWGQLNGRIKRNYTSTRNSAGVMSSDLNAATSASNNSSGMQPVLDLGIGLRWETNWCDNQYAFSLDAGWEHHVWFDQNSRVKLISPVIDNNANFSGGTGRSNLSYTEEITDLAMGGFVLRARFDF